MDAVLLVDDQWRQVLLVYENLSYKFIVLLYLFICLYRDYGQMLVGELALGEVEDGGHK